MKILFKDEEQQQSTFPPISTSAGIRGDRQSVHTLHRYTVYLVTADRNHRHPRKGAPNNQREWKVSERCVALLGSLLVDRVSIIFVAELETDRSV